MCGCGLMINMIKRANMQMCADVTSYSLECNEFACANKILIQRNDTGPFDLLAMMAPESMIGESGAKWLRSDAQAFGQAFWVHRVFAQIGWGLLGHGKLLNCKRQSAGRPAICP